MKSTTCIILACSLVITAAQSAQTRLSRRAFSPSDTAIVRLLSEVSESTVTSQIYALQEFGTRYWSDENRESVFDWVRNRFLESGITDVVVDSFAFNGTWQKNIIATIPGALYPDSEIVIGAHLDSYAPDVLHAPGADDNASGLSAVLELARVLKSADYRPTMTIRCIGFAGGEAGLEGSLAYAGKALAEGRDIRFMLNFDMIGYRDQLSEDNDCYAVWYPGSELFCEVYSSVAENYTTITPVMTSQYQNASDSWSFAHCGFNALFVTERDRNPYDHQPYDVLWVLDTPYASEIIRSGLAMIMLLDQVPPAPVNLTAEGIQGGVRLSWSRSATEDLSGYNVYRESSANDGFIRLNAEPVMDSVWTDTIADGGTYVYRVVAVDLVGLESSFSDSAIASSLLDVRAGATLPLAFRLEQNYPNPFNPTTTIRYDIPAASFVTLTVYDLVGREVATLVRMHQAPGAYNVGFDGSELPSGVYLYRLSSGTFTQTREFILMK